jgi:hypothetical protein
MPKSKVAWFCVAQWQDFTPPLTNKAPKFDIRVDFWGLALSSANKINGLMVHSCPNLRSLGVARRYKNTFDMMVL